MKIKKGVIFVLIVIVILMNVGKKEAGCDNVADTNQDCSITLSELMAYANLWINNQGPTISQVITIANIWINGGDYGSSGGGDINPCQTLTQSGTYTLTQDVTTTHSCMDISGNNIVLDCQGNTIQSGDGNIIHIGGTNNIVKNCITKGGNNGLEITGQNNIIQDSEFKEAIRYGIFLHNTEHITIENSQSHDNFHYDIFMQINQGGGCDNTFTNVRGTGGYLIPYFNQQTTFQNQRVSGLILCNADNSIIKNIDMNAYQGTTYNKNRNSIQIFKTSGTTFDDIEIINCYNGIELWKSDNNIIQNSRFEQLQYDNIRILYSEGNIIKSSILQYNDKNIGSRPSRAFSSLGINNIIYNNIFHDGMIQSSSGSVIDFFGYVRPNQWNTNLQPGTNIVNGNYIGGNHYSNAQRTGFSQTCSDSNNDKICDSAYTIASGNVDNYPLIRTN